MINDIFPPCDGLPANVLSAIDRIAIERDFGEYEIESRAISEPGENSYGLVLQVKLTTITAAATTAATEPFHCIVKMAPKHPARRQHMKVVEYYTREIFMYEHVFAEFFRIQKEMLGGNDDVPMSFDVVPKIYSWSLDNLDEFIIFQDLNQLHYKRNSRTNLPTFDLVTTALKALAKFHAMSFVVQAKKPEVFRKLVSQISENLFTESIEPVSIEFGKKYIRTTKSMLTEDHRSGARRRQLMHIVQLIEDNFKSVCLNAVNGAKCAPHAVICHGDFWNNNILYQYDGNNSNAIDAKLIDFQMSRYASPVLDIVHYLFACTEKELRDSYFNQFLDIYYDALASQLRLFALDAEKVFSYQIFQQHLKQYGVYGFCMSAFAIPFFISESCELPDLDEVSKAILELSSEESSDDETNGNGISCDESSKKDDHGNCNIKTGNEYDDRNRELVEEYEILTERTIPIFKRRMTGIVADLVKYNMVDHLLQLECKEPNKKYK